MQQSHLQPQGPVGHHQDIVGEAKYRVYKQRIEIAKEESERLFRVPEEVVGGMGKKDNMKYQKYESFEQFMKEDYELRVEKNKEKGRKMGVSMSVSEWYMPKGGQMRGESEGG